MVKQGDSEYSALWTNVMNGDLVRTYVESVARITWKMVLQRPSMEYRHATEQYEEQFYELHYQSSKDQPVANQVYPALFHGSHLMAKGKVLLASKENNDT